MREREHLRAARRGAPGDEHVLTQVPVLLQAIVEQRCVPCHSEEPTQEGFDSPPAGVTFDAATPEQS